MTSNWWRQRVQADDGRRDSVNHPEVKTTRAAVRHVACCTYIKENIRIQHNKSWLRSPMTESSWQHLLDDSPRHSPPILWPAPVWWLRLTPTPARPVYALLYPSLSLIILMMRYVRNVKQSKLFHQKEFFLTWSDLLMWSWCYQFTRLDECSHHLPGYKAQCCCC